MTTNAVTRLPKLQDAKLRYRELCRNTAGMPLFDQDWWLDAVCGGPDGWDVVLVEREGRIVASMPYYRVKKSWFQVMEMPQLTLMMGIRLYYPDGLDAAGKLAYERDIYRELISRLPAFDYFNQRFHWDMTNWSVFYWAGFRQTTRFTYVLEDISDTDRVYAGFSDGVKMDIVKAQALGVTVAACDDPALFHEINKRMFQPPQFTMPYAYEVLKPLDDALRARGQRKILIARDAEGRDLCAIYLVWDADNVYYFLGGDNPEARDTGAHALLVWEAVRTFAEPGRPRRFDFHGGMHEPVERIYRSFGAAQKPYFQISKIDGKLFRFAYHLKQALR